MKNALNYYYNLNPTSIHQINKNYKCYVGNEEYMLILYDGDMEYIQELQVLSYNLLQQGIPCHQILFNNSNKLITVINNLKYILLRIFITNRKITVDDLILFSYIRVDNDNFRRLIKNDWYNMWKTKVDYFEYQMSQFGRKYPIIMESANYYIGLAENSISFLSNNMLSETDVLSISHKRINNAGLIELFNPLNIILDDISRDIAEYIKNEFFYNDYNINEVTNDILKFNLNRNQYILLFSRLLFPSYYFDKFEEIVFEHKSPKELLKIINKNESYKFLLQQVYNSFIKELNILPMEWVIKT